MVRILEVITLGETGGAQTVLVDLIKGISDGGYDAEIDVVFGPGEYLPQALSPWFQGRVIQAPWLSRSINPYKDITAFLKLRDLCKTRKYDLVHCHSSKASWLARLAASWAGVPRICMTVHGLSFHPGNSPLVRQVYKNIEKFAIPLASEYIFVSPKDMAEMEALGLDAAKGKLIPNGRPVSPRPAAGLRDILPIPEDAPVVCMVARLSEVKNPMSFLRIAKTVIQQFPSDLPAPHFVLIGDGPMLADCRAAIIKDDLHNLVHLPGHRDQAGQYFGDADIAVLTSNYEACPLAAIEAMATGTPVVASDVGGTAHVVKHGRTGYLYSLNHEEEAARYIIELLKHKELREGMGRTALEHYQREFTVERMVDQYVEHFGLQKN
jgi:glycosyltransferase involved in cell wall biosynthesis